MKLSRFLIIEVALFIFALLLHLVVFGSTFTLQTSSDALFVIGILTFLPGVLALSKADTIFQGINYSLKLLVLKDFRSQYPNFKDYKDYKATSIKEKVYTEFLIASFIIVLVAVILSGVVMYG